MQVPSCGYASLRAHLQCAGRWSGVAGESLLALLGLCMGCVCNPVGRLSRAPISGLYTLLNVHVFSFSKQKSGLISLCGPQGVLLRLAAGGAGARLCLGGPTPAAGWHDRVCSYLRGISLLLSFPRYCIYCRLSLHVYCLLVK